jgi:isoquinoline 1-oxidoreductase subunit beta
MIKPGIIKDISRRKMLVGGGIGAGLLIAWGLWPRQYLPNLAAGKGEHLFGGWLKIAENGTIIIAAPQSEMGQGVHTILAQIIAGELGADWRTIAVQPVMPNPNFANNLVAREWAPAFVSPSIDPASWGDTGGKAIDAVAARNDFVITAGSSSVRQFEQACREAGAAARMLLCQAAAARWDTNWESCETDKGFVHFEKRKLAFSELVIEAAALPPPKKIILRASPINRLTSKDAPRLDAPAKVDGSISYAADIRLPGMVYASIRAGPIGDTKLKSIDRAKTKGLAGLVDVVENDRWVAALATNWWAANRALDLLAPVFTTKGQLADSGSMGAALDNALAKGQATQIYNTGSVAATLEKAAGSRVFKSRYTVAPAVHAPIETRSATAEYRDGRLRLWMATQAPEAACVAAADAIGISRNDVVLIPVMAGGSFGRNMDSQIAAQVAVLAEHAKRPVQLTWSRPEEFMRDHFRAPAAAMLTGSIDMVGRVLGLSTRIAVPATAREQARRLKGDDENTARIQTRDEFDIAAVEGAIPPYAIANMLVEHIPVAMPIPTGRWRGNAHSYTAFFTECFIDELATAAGMEPLSYRMQMLVGQTRLARCLTGVATMAGWNGGVAGSGRGIACHSMRGSHIALVASARTGETGVRVESISAMVDCGRIINPDIARQQIEGGIIFGLAQALGASTEFERGLPLATRLREIDLPILADIPEIIVEFVRSDEAPGGIGEIGVPPVAPAIANALFSASGLRLRELPLLSKGL